MVRITKKFIRQKYERDYMLKRKVQYESLLQKTQMKAANLYTEGKKSGKSKDEMVELLKKTKNKKKDWEEALHSFLISANKRIIFN